MLHRRSPSETRAYYEGYNAGVKAVAEQLVEDGEAKEKLIETLTRVTKLFLKTEGTNDDKLFRKDAQPRGR